MRYTSNENRKADVNRTLIGLTGNIATGKSVVRRMLVNHGALGLDADVIAHRTLYPGGRAYTAVVKAFGKEILETNGEINRSKLGEIVFSAPQKLKTLESLTHPAVTEAIRDRTQAAQLPIVVIEAIKLLETPLADLCQSIWISQAAESTQLERLLQVRKMDETQARQRIAAQAPQEEKRQQANVVITTEGSFSATWQQIRQALNDTIQSESTSPVPYINIDPNWTLTPAGALVPEALEEFWAAQTDKEPGALYEQLAFNVVQAVISGPEILALLISKDWNFTTTLTDVIPAENTSLPIPALITAIEASARQRQSEFLVLPDPLLKSALAGSDPANLDFTPQSASQVSFTAWRQAIMKTTGSQNAAVWTKVLSPPFGQS
jgi:dephospho-CoA kinase